jgi:hypothetical protein
MTSWEEEGCALRANYFRYYKRLGVIAKLATSYFFCGKTRHGAFKVKRKTRCLKSVDAILYEGL